MSKYLTFKGNLPPHDKVNIKFLHQRWFLFTVRVALQGDSFKTLLTSSPELFFFFTFVFLYTWVCVCIAKNCNQPFKTKLLEHTQPLATCRTPDFKPWKSASVVRLFPWKSLLVACISARSTPWRVWGETQWVAQLFPWVNLRKLQFDSWTLYLLSGTAPTDQDYMLICVSHMSIYTLAVIEVMLENILKWPDILYK